MAGPVLFTLFCGMVAVVVVHFVSYRMGFSNGTIAERKAAGEMRREELKRLKCQAGKAAFNAIQDRFEQYMQEMADQAK